MKFKISKNKYIEDKDPPYVIAEIGSNHNGDMNLCKKIVDAAKEAGADCVKFQFFSTRSIFSKKTYDDNYFIADDYRNRTDFTLKEIVEAYSMKKEQLVEMKNYSKKKDIDFLVTPFSKEEADVLVDEIGVDFLKIASMDCNNYDFVYHVAKKNLPTILSTGLSTLEEINKAVKTFEKSGNKNLILLHCVAIYPPNDEQTNLNRIKTLKKLYNYPVGFSDHSLGVELPIASVSLGARVIEKHFTIDKKMKGWDQHMSIDSEDLKFLSKGVRRVFTALGVSNIFRVESQERADAFKRSVVARVNIKNGQTITKEMLDVKRPGTGLPPEKLNSIIGKQAKRDISEDELIKQTDY
tara:strand:+ start:1986 stop:3041 length:1056 start_codon:yes stop_codon:yes gene_type:complete